MRTLFIVLLFRASFLLQGLPIPQEQKREPQTISTEPKEVVAELRRGETKLLEVRGILTYTPTEANYDDTTTGNLFFKLDEKQRLQISNVVKRVIADIPEDVTIKGIRGIFEKHAKCPDLRYEFRPQKVEVGDAMLHFGSFVVSFKETEQELSQLFCRWAKVIEGGRSHPPIRIVNALLKGEKID
ncbi:MAG: hypothetical protein JST85_13040 [Acidobacteria bacterium]|nr:hypothetical protein [Acidobacteriota bacterium]